MSLNISLMKLLIMRHGEALPIGGAIQDDSERPLSPRGKTQIEKVAGGLRQRVPLLKGILSSPLKRAVETAQILAQEYSLETIETSVHLSSNASAASLHALLKYHAQRETLLLVGHHPHVTVMVALLTGLDPSACPLFGVASIAALQWDPETLKAELLWFQTPEQLTQS